MESDDALAKLAEKLTKCYAGMETIPERGRNKYHGYNYVLAGDLFRAARDEFAKHGLAVIPRLGAPVHVERVKTKSGETNHMQMDMTFTLIDRETGCQLAIPWRTECIDDQDKGTGKMLTSSLKSFLKALLMVSTGDDPDAEPGTKADGALAATPEPEPEPQPQAPQTKEDKVRAFVRSLHVPQRMLGAFKDVCKHVGFDWQATLLDAQADGVNDLERLASYLCEAGMVSLEAFGRLVDGEDPETVLLVDAPSSAPPAQAEPEPAREEERSPAAEKAETSARSADMPTKQADADEPAPEDKPKHPEQVYYELAKELGWPSSRTIDTLSQMRVIRGILTAVAGERRSVKNMDELKAEDWQHMVDLATNVKEGVCRAPKEFQK